MMSPSERNQPSDWLPHEYWGAFSISNKLEISPKSPKPESEYIKDFGWQNGYSFRQFLGNVYAYLGELSALPGIQQLCHQYYLQNGGISAKDTAARIKKFLGVI